MKKREDIFNMYPIFRLKSKIKKMNVKMECKNFYI